MQLNSSLPLRQVAHKISLPWEVLICTFNDFIGRRFSHWGRGSEELLAQAENLLVPDH